MAATGARRSLRLSSSSAKAILSRTSAGSSASKAPNLVGISSSKPSFASSRFSLRRFTSSRVPVELGGGLSLMPLHSVIASALLTSLLSLSNQNWGCLSEGFATPL